MALLSTAAAIASSGLWATTAHAVAVALTPSQLLISGGGDGHGVGMSQDGALGYAQHGFTYGAILARYYTGTALATEPTDLNVRVLLSPGVSRVTVSGAREANSHHLSARGDYAIVRDGPGLTLRSSGRGVRGARIVMRGHGALRITGLGGHGSSVYRGALEFLPAGNAIEVINVVALDDYARGVVANEASASWPAAALEAQAVASRTYGLTSHERPGVDGFDVYPDTRSQVYGGYATETPTTDAAVAATAGQVVTYAGKPVTTYFFASSGGLTEDIENAFPGATAEPWLRGVADPYDQGSLHRWSRTLSFGAAASALSGLYSGAFEGIRVIKRGYSPRVVTAEVLGSELSTKVDGPELAGRLALPSTWAYFSVRVGTATRAEPDTSGYVAPNAGTLPTATAPTTPPVPTPAGGTPAS